MKHINTTLAILILLACVMGSKGSAQNAPSKRLNKVIELLERRQPPLGIFSLNLTARTGASVASAPIDFVIVDLEHTPYDPSRLESYLLGMTDKKQLVQGSLQPAVTPIVRLPANGREHVEYLIKQVLDLGAFGVVVPHVRNRDDALAAVHAMRYAQPDGAPDLPPKVIAVLATAGRPGIGVSPAATMSRKPISGRSIRKGNCFLVHVESREGVEHADEIASTPGVSGIFLGPSDLAVSLGVGEDHSKGGGSDPTRARQHARRPALRVEPS